MSKKISEMEDVKVEDVEQPQQQQPQEQSVSVSLTVNELNVVLQSLQELPHRIADPLLKSLVAQAQQQLGQ